MQNNNSSDSSKNPESNDERLARRSARDENDDDGDSVGLHYPMDMMSPLPPLPSFSFPRRTNVSPADRHVAILSIVDAALDIVAAPDMETLDGLSFDYLQRHDENSPSQ